MNWLAISIIILTIVRILNCMVCSGRLLLFHQALQAEKESGAEGKKDIGDSQEPLWTILKTKLKLLYNFIFITTTLMETTVSYCSHVEIF